MTDDPTPGEIERALSQFREDHRDDLRDIRATVEATSRQAVNANVYRADQRLVEERLRAMREDLTRMDTDHAGERAAARAWRERLDERRKWLIAGVILPIGGLLVEIIFALRGGK